MAEGASEKQQVPESWLPQAEWEARYKRKVKVEQSVKKVEEKGVKK